MAPGPFIELGKLLLSKPFAIQALLRRNVSSSAEIRKAFLKFYEDRQHTLVPSSKVFSPDDRSLLFVNAGMNQFKPIFLGKSTSESPFSGIKRAVNSQRCIRAGGKHNDLEDVGKDHTHHTFFEMLGSWSFGDYFKDKACQMAWEFLVDICKLPKDRLYVTYFGGCEKLGLESDMETREIWQSLGIPQERILPFGVKDNFWEMGDTGPCGPCTEIHYDTSESGQFVPQLVNVNNSSVVEIWNLVFMQYNRLDESTLTKLNSFHVDTGMGLERISTILQGQKSNYDTDLFKPIINKLEKLCGCRGYQGQMGDLDNDKIDQAYRIVADHIRMLTVAIGDGIFPGVRGRDLIVRQVLRRAVRQGMEPLRAPNIFLSRLVPVVISSLSDAMPDLERKQGQIIEVLNEAEQSFMDMVKTGNKTVARTIKKMGKDDQEFPTSVAINLKYQHGYPDEFLMAKLKKYGKTVDMEKVLKFGEDRDTESVQDPNSSKLRADLGNNLEQSIETSTLENYARTELVEPTQLLGGGESSFKSNLLAVVLDNGSLLAPSTELEEHERVYFLLDKSVDVISAKQHARELLTFTHSGKELPVTGIIDFDGWLLHEIPTSSFDDVTSDLSTSSEGQVEVKFNAANWKAVMRSHLASQAAITVIMDFGYAILKTSCGSDEFRLEISGKRSSEIINQIHESVADRVQGHARSNDPSTSSFLNEAGEFCIYKVNREGNSRTGIRCLTGEKAREALSHTSQIMESMQVFCDKVAQNRDDPDPTSTELLLEEAGKLTYNISALVISFDVKEISLKTLRRLSGNLNTKLKRLRASERKDATV